LLVCRPSHEIGQIDRSSNLGDDHSAGNRVQSFGQGLGAVAELANPVLIDLDLQALHRLIPVEIDQPRIRVLPDGLPDLGIAALIFCDPRLPGFAHPVVKAPATQGAYSYREILAQGFAEDPL
jgi:hypothetical protein